MKNNQSDMNTRIQYSSNLDKRIVVEKRVIKPCQHCDNSLLFELSNHNGDIYPVSIETILLCLKIAETNGLVPLLATDWWLSNNRQYRLSRGIDDELYYPLSQIPFEPSNHIQGNEFTFYLSNDQQAYAVSIKALLICLEIAERHSAVPVIADGWWATVKEFYAKW